MIWSESGMLVKVCAVLGGHGQDGTMKVVGWWWRREGVEGRRWRGVAYLTVYRWEDRVGWVLLKVSCGLLD